ncbi:hypothetical protein HMPREF1531_01103 [Propionibacterium sp. oral taxon 192 str. F0372]|nr:hypothetical protein HMPREF1531_01103 [Propionibacterium sp. oral taxon 192 str. F0372]
MLSEQGLRNCTIVLPHHKQRDILSNQDPMSPPSRLRYSWFSQSTAATQPGDHLGRKPEPPRHPGKDATKKPPAPPANVPTLLTWRQWRDLNPRVHFQRKLASKFWNGTQLCTQFYRRPRSAYLPRCPRPRTKASYLAATCPCAHACLLLVEASRILTRLSTFCPSLPSLLIADTPTAHPMLLPMPFSFIRLRLDIPIEVVRNRSRC